jgi:hypothetical protein
MRLTHVCLFAIGFLPSLYYYPPFSSRGAKIFWVLNWLAPKRRSQRRSFGAGAEVSALAPKFRRWRHKSHLFEEIVAPIFRR